MMHAPRLFVLQIDMMMTIYFAVFYCTIMITSAASLCNCTIHVTKLYKYQQKNRLIYKYLTSLILHQLMLGFLIFVSSWHHPSWTHYQLHWYKFYTLISLQVLAHLPFLYIYILYLCAVWEQWQKRKLFLLNLRTICSSPLWLSILNKNN